MDRTGEAWCVEPVLPPYPGEVLLRYRHELGYEVTAIAPAPLNRLGDGVLIAILETARRRVPGQPTAAA